MLQFMKVVIQTRMADPAKHGLNASKIEYGALVTDVYLLKTKAEVGASGVDKDEPTKSF